MKDSKLKFEDFTFEKLSKNEQKTVRGGDGDTDPTSQTGKGAN